jgi:hypothetical protein
MKRSLYAVLLFCLLIASAGWAQTPAETYSDSPVMPAGIQGQRIQALLATLNSGKPEQIKEFLSTHCTERFRNFVPMEDHIEVFLGFLQESGGIDFSGIRTYVPERKGQTVVIVKDRNYQSFRGLTLRFADAPEYLIGGAGFSPARPPADLKGTGPCRDQGLHGQDHRQGIVFRDAPHRQGRSGPPDHGRGRSEQGLPCAQ